MLDPADSSTDEYAGPDGVSDASDSDIEDRITHDSTNCNRSHRTSYLSGQDVTSGFNAHSAPGEPDDAVEGSSSDYTREGDPFSKKTLRQNSRGRSQSVDSVTGTAGALTTEYRDLLNEMIVDASGQASLLEPELSSSQIGATFWSAREKHVLFHALEKYGEGDVARLEVALRTKSQHEIQVYLSLLREGLTTLSRSNTRDSVQLCDIYAAAEVPDECEIALNGAADKLSSRVEQHEQLTERTQSQKNWLIDAESAEREEQEYEEALKVEAEVTGDIDAALDSDRGSSDGAGLLRHATFLQLSRNLFMNHGEHDDLNWQHVDLVTDVTKEPALFRRAAGDFHDIAVSLTRRLVQASIFQAMSRLRASDSSRADWAPLAVVRETDVRSAAELVNMSPSWHGYWAGVARRCRVKVYSGSKKYNDGRSGTKSGYRLTYEELEMELGVEKSKPGSHTEDESSDIFEEDVDELMDDSDAFTDDPAVTAPARADDSDEFGNKSSRPLDSGRRRKRSRTQSPTGLRITQDEELEALDRIKSTQEQVRLWQAVRIEPPDSTVDAGLHDVRPRIKQTTANGDSTTRNWRAALDYVAEWEVQSGPPRSEDFHDMAMAGHRGRKRKRLLEANVNARLGSVQQKPLDVTGPKVEAASSGEDSEATEYSGGTEPMPND